MIHSRILSFIVAAAMSALFSMAALAQEISETHLAAAKEVMNVTGATKQMDIILPQLAEVSKNTLISTRPDKEQEIADTVNDVAIELAPRRGMLEDEIAQIYARIFTEEELSQIHDFYASDAGKKMVKETPILFREIEKAAKVWRIGLGRDMSEMVRAKLKEKGIE